MIELLVVIAVIGLLIAAIVGIANAAIHNQKVRNTRAIMKNVTLAIDQFKEEDPLRLIYNGKNPTFGPFPPYQLANAPDTANQNSLVYNLEANPPGANDTLAQRLGRDFLNDASPAEGPTGVVDLDPNQATNRDIQALYTYLKVLMPSGLTQVPESALKPLNPQYPPPGEFVNPTGNSSNTEAQVGIFGIHDAWGVPLDYLLYVKLEWTWRRDPLLGVEQAGMKIADRIPVLRSRGISREVYDVQQNDPQAPRDPSKWIFSTEFPSPLADVANTGFWANGVFLAGNATGNGWARAKALAEDYGYVPTEHDGEQQQP